MTQERLGEAVNKTKGNISAWEKGRHEPSFDQIEAISRITGYPMPTAEASGQDEIVLQAASVKDMLDELERRGESEVAKLFFEYARRKEKGG
ncbi:helix-turn-helix domain-containing protein [Chromobacterium haemolyticum]|nr:helix-turn-helix domain-containing protein [Chromobacterium haemolyticum]